MKKKRGKKEEPKVRQLTAEELAEEEKKYQACKKPIRIAWGLYGLAAALYVTTGLVTQLAVDAIPQKLPPAQSLKDYKNTQEYNDFVTQAQKEAFKRFEAGEITFEDYEYVAKTVSSDEKFEEFLRDIENDPYIQKTLAEYDEYVKQINSVGKKYSALSIVSLSSILVSTLILAKYRNQEMAIEEDRKKRDEARAMEEHQMR